MKTIFDLRRDRQALIASLLLTVVAISICIYGFYTLLGVAKMVTFVVLLLALNLLWPKKKRAMLGSLFCTITILVAYSLVGFWGILAVAIVSISTVGLMVYFDGRADEMNKKYARWYVDEKGISHPVKN